MIGISNASLNNILKKKCSYFKGVYACDKIPSTLKTKKHFAIVCNLSVSNQPGSHFISIIAMPNYVLYIDSIGIPITNIYIQRFLELMKRVVYVNTKQLQAIESMHCGFYCIMYVLHFSKNENYQRRNKLVFTTDLALNDKKCVSYVKRLLIDK